MGEGGRPTVTREHRKLIIENAGSAQVFLFYQNAFDETARIDYYTFTAGKREQQCRKKQREA